MGTNKLFDYFDKEPKEWEEWIGTLDNPDEIKGIKQKVITALKED